MADPLVFRNAQGHLADYAGLTLAAVYVTADGPIIRAMSTVAEVAAFEVDTADAPTYTRPTFTALYDTDDPDGNDRLRIDPDDNPTANTLGAPSVAGIVFAVAATGELISFLPAVDSPGVTEDDIIAPDGIATIGPPTEGAILEIVPGTNITVDDTDPLRPVVSSAAAAAGLPPDGDFGDLLVKSGPDDYEAVWVPIDELGLGGSGLPPHLIDLSADTSPHTVDLLAEVPDGATAVLISLPEGDGDQVVEVTGISSGWTNRPGLGFTATIPDFSSETVTVTWDLPYAFETLVGAGAVSVRMDPQYGGALIPLIPPGGGVAGPAVTADAIFAVTAVDGTATEFTVLTPKPGAAENGVIPAGFTSPFTIPDPATLAGFIGSMGGQIIVAIPTLGAVYRITDTGVEDPWELVPASTVKVVAQGWEAIPLNGRWHTITPDPGAAVTAARLGRDQQAALGGGAGPFALVCHPTENLNGAYEHPDVGPLDGDEVLVFTRAAPLSIVGDTQFLEKLTQFRNPGTSVDQDNYEFADFVKHGTVFDFVEHCQIGDPAPVEAGENEAGRMSGDNVPDSYVTLDQDNHRALGIVADRLHRYVFDNGDGVWEQWMYRRVWAEVDADFTHTIDGLTTWWKTSMRKVGEAPGSIADAGQPWLIGCGFGRMAVFQVTVWMDGVRLLDFQAANGDPDTGVVPDGISGEDWEPGVHSRILDLTPDGILALIAGGGGGGLALGSTSTTAHRGDHGATAYTHSQVTTGNPHGTTAADVGAPTSAELAAMDPWVHDIIPVQGWAASGGGGTPTRAQSSSLYHGGSVTLGNAAGRWVEWKFTASGGTYDIDIIGRHGTVYGVGTVKIDGTSVGTLTQYNAAATSNDVDSLTGVTIARGLRTLRIETVGTGAGTAYSLALIGVQIRRTA